MKELKEKIEALQSYINICNKRLNEAVDYNLNKGDIEHYNDAISYAYKSIGKLIEQHAEETKQPYNDIVKAVFEGNERLINSLSK